MPSKLTSCKLSSTTTRTKNSRTKPRTCTSMKLELLPVQAYTSLTGAPHRSDRCSPASSTFNSLPLSPSLNCPHTRLGPGHLRTRFRHIMRWVVPVLVCPLLSHSRLSPSLIAKLFLVTILSTKLTMETD
jgi:hypothetical protein